MIQISNNKVQKSTSLNWLITIRIYLSNHCPVVYAESHVSSENFSVPFSAHHLHHFLQPFVAADASN